MTTITLTQPTIQVPIMLSSGQTVTVDLPGSTQIDLQLVGIQGPPGEGGGGGNAPATVTGTADALALSGITVGADPMVITLVPIANNTGPATASINGGSALPILSRLGQPLAEDELIAGVPVMAILTPGVSLQLIVS
jgi:hypothetical protein